MSGKVGDNVFRASGLVKAAAAGRTGTVDWCTTAKTSPLTAESGKGYFVNTTCGAITVTLPASPTAGDIVSLKDYAETWDSNAVTLARNSSKIGGMCFDATLSTEGQSITMVYVDGTQGWENIQTDTSVKGNEYLTATGGTIVTCGDYKTHIFTGDGCFAVSKVGVTAPNNVVDYLVVAGGGSGGSGGAPSYMSGGGGGGGFRVFSTAPGSNSPLNNSGASPNTEVTVTATTYPITIGGGGAAASADNTKGCAGTVSTFSTVTSAGGGFGAAGGGTPEAGGPGGSGGGSSQGQAGGTGNDPPVSPAQGQDGGVGDAGNNNSGGGGGGAGATGGPSPGPNVGGPGADGSYIAESFIGPTSGSYGTPGPVSVTRYFAGGGGAPSNGPSAPAAPTGGAGGGGDGGPGGNPGGVDAGAGTTNTGGGGGGGAFDPPGGVPGAGGSGFVAIRYKYQ